MPRKYYKCEMCQEMKCSDPQDTVCKSCDRELNENSASLLLAHEQGRKKYNCHTCGKDTGPSRRIHCVKCVPDCLRDSEDPYFDGADDLDFDTRGGNFREVG